MSSQYGHMPLNWDILCNIAPFLGKGGWLLRYMETCHTLYSAGVPVLVDQMINFGDHMGRDKSFCAFILRNPARASLVHSLRIWSIPPTDFEIVPGPSLMTDIVTVVRFCLNIKHIVIPESETLALRMELASAVASLAHLKRIHMDNVGPQAITLLMKIRSPIVYASIHLCDPEMIFQESQSINPAYFLQHLKDYLVDVRLASCAFVPSPTISFDKVRRLMVVSPRHQTLCDDISTLFPNICEFNLTGWSGNAIDQGRQAKLESRRVLTWKTLDHLFCDVTTTYALALTCKVRVWEAPIVNDSRQLSQFKAALMDIRPSCLSVGIYVEHLTQDEACNIFPKCEISHLNLEIHLEDRDTDVREFMNNMARNLSDLSSLVSLDMWLYYVSNPMSSHSSEASPNMTLNSLQSLDRTSFAVHLLQTAPSLQYILVYAQCNAEEFTAWRVLRSDDGVATLEEMDDAMDVVSFRVKSFKSSP